MEQKVKQFDIRQLVHLAGSGDRDDDFIVFNEWTISKDDMLSGPFRRSVMTIALCTAGRIVGHLNFKRFNIESDTLAVGFPNSVVQLDCGEGSSLRGILVSEEFMRGIHINLKEMLPLYMEVVRNPMLKLSEEDRCEIGHYFDLLETICHKVDQPHRLEVVRGIVTALLYRVGDIYCMSRSMDGGDQSVRSRREEYFVKFISLLSENFKSQRTVGFYASKLCVTPKYLSLLIKEVSGKSAADWIDSYVILEAKTLLRFSTMSIQEVAYALNFSSQSFFGKYFKHQTGMSPSQYKVSNGEK